MREYIAIVTAGLLFCTAGAVNADDSKRKLVRNPEASVREGRRLFLESSCMTCHSVGGKGGTSAPALDGIGKVRSRSYIEAKIRDPQAHPINVVRGLATSAKRKAKTSTKSRMIQADLFDDQIKSLTDYLLTLKKKG